MAKSKSGYKRRYGYQPPEGVKIEIRTEEAYQKLATCAKANACTVGRLAEAWILYALSGEPYIPPYKHVGRATPAKRPRSFKLSEQAYEAVERKVGADQAKVWIAKTLLSLAQIELLRLEGLGKEPDRFT